MATGFKGRGLNVTKKIERRWLIGGMGLLGLTMVLPSAATSGLLGPHAAATAERLIGDLFGNIDSAREVGRAYLAQTPAEADRAVLTASLQDVLATANRETVRSKLRHDFATGNVVTVRGWMLSRTEARLCGLAVLT